MFFSLGEICLGGSHLLRMSGQRIRMDRVTHMWREIGNGSMLFHAGPPNWVRSIPEHRICRGNRVRWRHKRVRIDTFCRQSPFAYGVDGGAHEDLDYEVRLRNFVRHRRSLVRCWSWYG